MMIKPFACKETESLFNEIPVRRFQSIEQQARRKLLYLHSVKNLQDLMQPPGNKLETLKGYRKGQHSIRINDQWHICFKWREGNAYNVEIVDYH
jgi:toxin HigB-1